MTSSRTGLAVSIAVHALVIALALWPARRAVPIDLPPGGPTRILFIKNGQSPKTQAGRADPPARPPQVKKHHELLPPRPATSTPAPTELAAEPEPTRTPDADDSPDDDGDPDALIGGGSSLGEITGSGGTGPAAPVPFAEQTMTPPQRLSGPDPRYTSQALEHEIEGIMLVRCVVGLDGAVRECRVTRGLPFMDSEVVSALERRRYSPALLGGRPVEVEYLFRIELRLP